MGCEADGDLANQFALVIYIPDPLCSFLDKLRLKLVPGCEPHAHVSVLPPRPLSADWRLAMEQVRTLAADFEPFEIEAGDIAIFPKTDVVYLELTQGTQQLRSMHDLMNHGKLAYPEPFTYHPHITLAQNLDKTAVDGVFREACRTWREFRGSRAFWAEKLVLVQNAGDNRWVDLAALSLGGVPVV